MPGDEIRAARKKAGMTQTDTFGLTPTLPLSLWIPRDVLPVPSVKMLRRICIVLGTTPDSILGFCKSKKGAANGNTGD